MTRDQLTIGTSPRSQNSKATGQFFGVLDIAGMLNLLLFLELLGHFNLDDQKDK